jgi:SIR2-like protein
MSSVRRPEDMPTQHSQQNEDGRAAGLASLVRLIADRAADPGGHRTKICLFLGAGADMSSGGLSFADLKRSALEELSGRKLFDVTTAARVEAEFEAFFVDLKADDRALLIESLFRRMQPLRPSDAYKLLVLLAEAGGIDAVVTTNFDLMLERAQALLGRDVFQVFGPGLARPYLVSYERYELPKKPYLKLHGDLASRSVTLLTPAELERSTYDPSMLELLTSILQTHDIVFAGYSGYDRVLSRVITDSLGPQNRVYWCNPTGPSVESPLFTRIGDRVTAIPIGFDTMMMAIARPVLEQPALAPTQPSYLRCLFDWRVDYCNREYLQNYGERAGKSVIEVFARRPTIEDQLSRFVRPNRSLAIIAGPSGYGKTTIGLRLHKLWRSDTTTRLLLIRSRTLADNIDLEQHVMEQLGGLGSHGPFSLLQLERWLKEMGVRLILFVDAVNEFSPELAGCVQFFRAILRFCYFLPERNSAIRVVATMRQETWHAMLPHIDTAQLRKVLWTERESDDSINAIACGSFTDEELQDALVRLREQGYASINADTLPPGALDRLRDPYLLAMLVEAVAAGLPAVPSARVYQRALEMRLQRRGAFIDVATMKDILADVALQCLARRLERFREIDVHPLALRADIIRVAKDLGIIVDAGDGFLQFDHDRTFEYFLAIGLASHAEPSMETLDDLRQFLRRFQRDGRAVAAARLYYQLAPDERIPTLTAALGFMDEPRFGYDAGDCELVFGFARDVIVTMVEAGEPLAERYVSDAIDAAQRDALGHHQVRAAVHAAARLPLQRSIPLLAKVAHRQASLAGTEAAIFATDGLVRELLTHDNTQIDLLRDEPFAGLLADQSLAPWKRVGSLLRLAAQLGPDNTHPSEYAPIAQAMDRALREIVTKEPWSATDVADIHDFFVRNCDRLLFNATRQGMNRFFGNPRRKDLSDLIDRVADGSVLSEVDFATVEPYTQSLASDIEYHLLHAIVALSSLNDVEGTLRLLETLYSRFSDATPPEEIDFFHAALVYVHVLNGRRYDAGRFAPWEDAILSGWRSTLLYRPGTERGERRGFDDPFDRIFEDGFGVIYAYGTLMPSITRVALRYEEYNRQVAALRESPLVLYTRHLERYLRGGQVEEAIQVLHALAGIIVAWPIEGLLALRSAIGHEDPRVRRATVRVLAEAYQRHPKETMSFLQRSGAAISDDELIDISIRQDARVGRRQVEEHEWARVGHFLLQSPGGRNKLVTCLRALVGASSIEDAVSSIVHALGMSDVADR